MYLGSTMTVSFFRCISTLPPSSQPSHRQGMQKTGWEWQWVGGGGGGGAVQWASRPSFEWGGSGEWGGFKRLAIGSMYVVAFILGLLCSQAYFVTCCASSCEGSNRFICVILDELLLLKSLGSRLGSVCVCCACVCERCARV